MITLSLTAIGAFVVSLTLTPLICRWALRHNIVDQAGVEKRKAHTQNTPRLGGIAIVCGVFAPLLGLLIFDTGVGRLLALDAHLVEGLLGCAAAIAFLGLYDDLFGSSAWLKFGVQIAAASLVYALGLQVHTIDLPLLPAIHLGALAYPFTLCWLVGVTNAINLIDGLDGLAAGLALCGLMPMLVFSLMTGNLLAALVCCALIGSIAGFLVFNFHPAKIFMGDTGSLFLGFTLASLSIQVHQKSPAAVAMLAPILALGLPIMDTLLAITRRAWRGQQLFVADGDHIHHRLMKGGLSHRKTVVVMYAFAAVLAALGLVTAVWRDMSAGLAFAAALIIAVALIRWVGYARSVRPRLMAWRQEWSDITDIRRINYAIRRLGGEADTAQNVEAVMNILQRLVDLLGASQAELVIVESSKDTCEAKETVVQTWGDAKLKKVASDRLEVRLCLDAQQLGQLRLAWEHTNRRLPDFVPTVEASSGSFARSLKAYEAELVQRHH
jgi:UDP-GlcNAc:undecaprenyl-phosphate/decaprenyl-phosphate GlcNAc-1-phosphate transferase